MKKPGVKGSIPYDVSEEEIQKEIEVYKKSVKIQKSCFTDEEIRDFCIKSLVRHKVESRSYINPEKIKSV